MMKILSSNNCKQLLHYAETNVSSIHSIVDAMSDLRLRVPGHDDMLTLIIEKSVKTLLSLCRQREALMKLFRDEEQLNAGDDDDDAAMVNALNYLERSLGERDQGKIAVEATLKKLQATLKNVREELEDIQEDMGHQVLFINFLQSKIDELAALAEAGGANGAQVAEIKGRSYSSMSS